MLALCLSRMHHKRANARLCAACSPRELGLRQLGCVAQRAIEAIPSQALQCTQTHHSQRCFHIMDTCASAALTHPLTRSPSPHQPASLQSFTTSTSPIHTHPTHANSPLAARPSKIQASYRNLQVVNTAVRDHTYTVCFA